MSFWAEGVWAEGFWANGFWQTDGTPTPAGYSDERRPRRHPTKQPELGYDPALRGQLLDEDNELLELVTLLVTRILK